MNIGTGGADASFGAISSAMSGAFVAGLNTVIGINSLVSGNENKIMMRAQYGYGDSQQKNNLYAILAGKASINFVDEINDKDGTATDARGKTILDNRKRIIDMVGSSKEMSIAKQLAMAVTLGHEAYRDGIQGANNTIETQNAVFGHTAMAARLLRDGMYSSAMFASVMGDKNLQSDLQNIFSGATRDEFNKYVDESYDSSADYWKLMNDGTLVNDNKGWLTDEKGNPIKDKSGKQIGAKGVETGLLNILFGGTSGVAYKTYSEEQIQLAQFLMSNSGMKHTESATKTIQTRSWSGNEMGQELNMDIVMFGAGKSIATQVFSKYYDSTVDIQMAENTMNKWVPLEAQNRYNDLYSTKLNFYYGIGALLAEESRLTGAYASYLTNNDGSIASDYKNYYVGYDNKHFGIDLAGDGNETIKAAISGTVTESGYDEISGNHVRIEYGYQFEGQTIGTGIFGEYLHMAGTPLVGKGNYVSSTTKLGIVGNTGKSKGNHLHYSVYTSMGDTYSTTTAKTLLGADYASTAMQSYYVDSAGKKTTVKNNKIVYDPTFFYQMNKDRYLTF
jgi:murein DD-endopeptidase MepM/ murein hydrolase activator NlpD